MIRGSRAIVAVSIALCSAPLFAHDLWIEPTTFSPNLGEVVGVRLRVGQDLVGDPLPLIPALVDQFVVQDAADRKPVVGRRGTDPAGVMRVAMPGLHIVGYHSHPSTVELAAEKFNAHLIEEGLEAIADLRVRRNETGAKSREMFSRCAKSLLLSGSPNDTQADRRLGFPLELVAERNPYTLRAGQDLPVRLTYRDQPLLGALFVAMSSLNPAEKQAARTDNDGRVRFRVHLGGMWLVKAVHMVPAPAGADAEWASFWASLTFESRGTSGAGN